MCDASATVRHRIRTRVDRALVPSHDGRNTRDGQGRCGGMACPRASGALAMCRERVMSYVKYCKAQAAECARRAELASPPEPPAERRRFGLGWLKLAEKAKAAPPGRS